MFLIGQPASPPLVPSPHIVASNQANYDMGKLVLL